MFQFCKKLFNKNVNKSQQYTAFTLAEVLITLGIIGIVASMTIPLVVGEYQKAVYVAQLKKFYSTFTQALRQMSISYGCDDLVCTGLFAHNANGTKLLGDEIIKYIKIAKNCGISTTMDCFPDKINYKYDGSSASNLEYNGNNYIYKIVTADGMSVGISNAASNGDEAAYADCKAQDICARVNVDINGLKGPNRSGRDNFEFFVSKAKGIKLIPPVNGEINFIIQANEACDSVVSSCEAKIIMENWEMNY